MDDRLLDLFEGLIAVQLDTLPAGDDVEHMAHACVCYRCHELLATHPTTFHHHRRTLPSERPSLLSESGRLLLEYRTEKEQVLQPYAELWDQLRRAS
jgi:hypothetical protein